MTKKRGLFIVLEGIDRVGKSTQAQLLADFLSHSFSSETYHIRFPDRTTTIGQSLNNYLCGDVEMDPHAVHLLFTANRWERAADIEKVLSDGRCVVADRYSYSGIVYTSSKDGAPDWEWCLRSEEGLPKPDLILCLLPENVGDLVERGGYGDERFDSVSFQNRVTANYRRLSTDISKRHQSEDGLGPKWEWVVIGKMTIQEVHSVIRDKLTSIMPNKSSI